MAKTPARATRKKKPPMLPATFTQVRLLAIIAAKSEETEQLYRKIHGLEANVGPVVDQIKQLQQQIEYWKAAADTFGATLIKDDIIELETDRFDNLGKQLAQGLHELKVRLDRPPKPMEIPRWLAWISDRVRYLRDT